MGGERGRFGGGGGGRLLFLNDHLQTVTKPLSCLNWKQLFLFPPSTFSIHLADTPTVRDKKKRKKDVELHPLHVHPVTSNTADAAECDLLQASFLSSAVLHVLRSELGAVFAHTDAQNSRVLPCLLLAVLFQSSCTSERFFFPPPQGYFQT